MNEFCGQFIEEMHVRPSEDFLNPGLQLQFRWKSRVEFGGHVIVTGKATQFRPSTPNWNLGLQTQIPWGFGDALVPQGAGTHAPLRGSHCKFGLQTQALFWSTVAPGGHITRGGCGGGGDAQNVPIRTKPSLQMQVLVLGSKT